jgi:hypothetical protein
LNNGIGDALRHALFRALNSRDLGLDLTKRLGDAHALHPWETPLGRDMDLFNNDVGRQIFAILHKRGLAGHYSSGVCDVGYYTFATGLLREISRFPPRRTQLADKKYETIYIFIRGPLSCVRLESK